MATELKERFTISANDVELVSINFTDHLDSGELLTGTPTVTEQTTSDLTLSNKAVSTATYVEAKTNETVAIGMAVQFTVTASGTTGTYTIRVVVSTDSTPARTFERDLVLYVE